MDDWAKVILSSKYYEDIPPSDDRYKNFLQKIKDKQKKIKLIKKKEKTGKGYHYGGNIQECSRSILDDVSRLEVVTGGKRAGNNSPEIINEAAEICQRLFQGHVIDIGLYCSLINELIDDYYSD